MSRAPLEGVKVLDISHYVAGAYCARLAASSGAEVIKLEKPYGGDPARYLGPFAGVEPHPEKSLLFSYLNTGKKGITLNLEDETGREIFKELIQKTDILVENFRPRVMPGLGLDYEALRKINPGLIMVSISNFGQNGPYSNYHAKEINMQAAGGLTYLEGYPEREPLKLPGYIGQYFAGLYGFLGSLFAFYARDVLGRGQQIDISIQEAVAVMVMHYQLYWPMIGEIVKRWRIRPIGHPYGSYPCKDGYVGLQMIIFHKKRWAHFAEFLKMPELNEPPFDTNKGRLEHAEDLDALLVKGLAGLTKKEIYHGTQALKLPFGYVATPEDVLNSPQLGAREFFVDIEHPIMGKVKYPGTNFKMSEVDWEIGRSPLLGEHNEQIYKELNFSKEDLIELKTFGVI